MVGSTLIPARLLCSCGQVLLWETPAAWEGHLLDATGPETAAERVNAGLPAVDAPGRPQDPQVAPAPTEHAQQLARVARLHVREDRGYGPENASHRRPGQVRDRTVEYANAARKRALARA